MLELRGVGTGYGKARILNGLSLGVDSGRTLAVVGPNGAGKTTLVKLIAGLLRCWDGSVFFEDQEITTEAAQARAQRGIVLCPEGRRILSTLTVEENLKLGCTTLLKRDGRGAVAAALDAAYAQFPILWDRRRSAGGTLSGGQQQMLALARALVSRPRLLLLDEPSLGLAPQIISDVYGHLDGLRKAGLSMVLVEEGATRALEFADDAAVMRNGSVALAGAAADLLSHASLHAAYLGQSSEEVST